MDSITDLINNKADEIFPTQTLSPINHSTTSDDKIDNQLDLEDYNEIEENYDQKENKNEIIIDKIVADEKPSEKSTQTQSNTENIQIDLEKLKSKKVKKIERIRKIGILTKDPNNEQWCVTENNNKYMILTASVTFYKGKPGDEVIFIVAKDIPNSWAAVDNIIR